MPTRPPLSLNDLSDYDARKGMPRYLSDLLQVHEQYRDNGTPMPDYRSHMFADFDTKIEQLSFTDLLTSHCEHPRIAAIYDLMKRHSRKWQITIPGLVKRFNARVRRKITLCSFRKGVSELRALGLVETIPVMTYATRGTAKPGYAGSIVRIKRRAEWPAPFNPDGPTLSELQSQPGYSIAKGRVEPKVPLGKWGRSSRNAEQYMLDAYTGEVIERATGAVSFVFDWQVRDKWNAFKFVQKFLAQEGSKVRCPGQPLYINEIEISNNEITPFPVPGDWEPRFPEPILFSPESSASCSVMAQPIIDPEQIKWPSWFTEDEKTDPEDQEQRYLDQQDRLAIWKEELLPEDSPGIDPVDGRYCQLSSGTLGLDSYRMSDQADFYLTGNTYCREDVSRWLFNSHAGVLLRRAVRYDTLPEDQQLSFGRIWMRRFVNAVRKDERYEVLRQSGRKVKPGAFYQKSLFYRIEQMTLLNMARDWEYSVDKPYTVAEMFDLKKTFRIHVTSNRWTMVNNYQNELTHRMIDRQRQINRVGQAGLCRQLDQQAQEFGERLLAGDYEEWSPFYQAKADCYGDPAVDKVSWSVESQERYIVMMWGTLGVIDRLREQPHGDKAIGYIDSICAKLSRSWKLMALNHTSMGDALMSRFLDLENNHNVPASVIQTTRERFSQFFEVMPAEAALDHLVCSRAIKSCDYLGDGLINRSDIEVTRSLVTENFILGLDQNGVPIYPKTNVYNNRQLPCRNFKY